MLVSKKLLGKPPYLQQQQQQQQQHWHQKSGKYYLYDFLSFKNQMPNQNYMVVPENTKFTGKYQILWITR